MARFVLHSEVKAPIPAPYPALRVAPGGFCLSPSDKRNNTRASQIQVLASVHNSQLPVSIAPNALIWQWPASLGQNSRSQFNCTEFALFDYAA